MHAIIRATHIRRQGRVLIIALALAAVFAFAGATSAMARTSLAASTSSIDPQANALPPKPNIAHELRIEQASPGTERLEFSARLTEDGGLIQRPIRWKLHRLGGETVFEGSMPVATVIAEPGDYLIEAQYGSVHAGQAITLASGQHIGITLVLNVGGIRVLPRLVGIGLPALPVLTSIYATSGPDRGRLVTISREPGAIIRLGAGSYRVESQFTQGNARVSTEVSVKPGLLTSVEIDHQAGIAHFPAMDHSGKPVSWVVTDERGREFPVEGTDLVLTTGSYVANVQSGTSKRSFPFTIRAGDRLEMAAR